MVIVSSEGKSEALISKVDIPNTQGEMPNIVPDLCQCLILCYGEGSLETGEGHVILLGKEAAEAKVVVEFCRANSHLDRRQ